jgi:hypothetical protein
MKIGLWIGVAGGAAGGLIGAVNPMLGAAVGAAAAAIGGLLQRKEDRPWRMDFTSSDWLESSSTNEYVIDVPAKRHRKGQTPTVSVQALQPSGLYTAIVFPFDYVASDGSVQLMVNDQPFPGRLTIA